MRATKYNVLTVVPHYAEAAAVVANPGDCAIVRRGGVYRQLVIQCPDGCGEILSINLDPRSGPAWRIYKKRKVWSLFPSISKPTGCCSHFIFWRGLILWCGRLLEDEKIETPSILPKRILEAFPVGKSVGFVELAEKLDEVPWDVLAACRSMARCDELEEEDYLKGIFSRKR